MHKSPEEWADYLQQHWYEVHCQPVDDKIPSPLAFLTLPFTKDNLVWSLRKQGVLINVIGKKFPHISEGYVYSAEEAAIHGKEVHAGIDFDAPYRTPVVAPCDGWAMASYHSTKITDNEGKPFYHRGKTIGYALGLFVQIWVPEVGRFVQLGHLSSIHESIPYSMPTPNGDDCIPTNHNLPIERIPYSSEAYGYIKRGEPVGTVGHSGLQSGYHLEYDIRRSRPPFLSPWRNRSWDTPHVHVEDYYRSQITQQKDGQRDPYGIYNIFEFYPTPAKPERLHLINEPLFLIGSNGLPIYADWREQ